MAWYNTNWGYRKLIDINTPAEVDGAFEYTFDVTDTDLTKAQSSGDDILFTLPDGETKIPHEIDFFDGGTGELVTFIEIPNYDFDQDIYIYYGNSGASNQENVAGTWDDNDWDHVSHLSEDSGSPYNSALQQTFTNNGAEQGVTGQVYQAYDFDATNSEYLTESWASAASGEFWAGAWVNVPSGASGTVFQIDINTGGGFAELYINSSGEPTGNIGGSVLTTSTAVDDGTWHHIGIRQRVGEQALMVDGDAVTTSSTTVTVDQIGNRSIGAQISGSNFLTATIDEVKITNNPPTGPLGSDDFVEALYAVETGGTYTLSTEEDYTSVTATQPTGSATMLAANGSDVIICQQEPGIATMNTAQVSSFDVSTTQVQSDASMNGITLNTILDATQVSSVASMDQTNVTDNIDATQFTITSSTLTAQPEEDLDRWIVMDAEENEYEIDAIELDGGIPQFRRGRTLTRTFLFYDDSTIKKHKNTYETIRDRFGKYLTQDTIRTVETYDGVPHYKQNINPSAEASSMLWEVVPNPSISSLEPWWVVVTNIEDSTRMVGPTETLEITMLPLAPVSEGDRTYITDNFEVQ